MIVVDAKAFAEATNAASLAMVAILVLRVVIKLTNGAKVASELNVTLCTVFSYGLIGKSTVDAGNHLSSVTVYLMVFVFVVATATRVVLVAAFGANPTIALVVFAAGGCTFAWERAWGFRNETVDGSASCFSVDLGDACLALAIGVAGGDSGADGFAELAIRG